MGLRVSALVLAFAVVLMGCGSAKDSAKKIEINVGSHRIAVEPPQGWSLIDQGHEKRFRKGSEQLAIIDLGVAGPRGKFQTHSAEALLESILVQLGKDERRSIGSQETRRIQGRTFYMIETWDRLSHQYPRRFAVARNGNTLLVVHTAFGFSADILSAFDSLMDSLELLNGEASLLIP